MHRLHLKINYLLKKEITELYLMNAIRAFALSTISIFIPIYLIKLGFSLLDVSLYLFTYIFIGILLCYIALKFASRYGVKKTIYISIPTTILFFIYLYNIGFVLSHLSHFLTLFFLSILQALSGAFYYMGFHIEFAKFSETKKSVKQLGIINALATLASILGPYLGALIITNFSFNLLFIIIIFLLSLSIIPLFFSKEFHQKFNFRVNNIFSKDKLIEGLPYLGEGYKDISVRVLWPILLFYMAINIKSIGFVYTIANAILVVFTIYISKKIKHNNKKRILKVGTYIHSISVITRTFFDTISTIVFIQGIGAFSWAMISLPFTSYFYESSKKKGIGETIYFREFFLHVGRITSIIVLILLLYLFGSKYGLMINIISGALFIMMMNKVALY